MELSIQFMSKSFDEIKQNLNTQKTEIKELRKRVTELEEKDHKSKHVQDQLLQEVNELEFRSRRLNLEVHGIPATQNENLITSLKVVANKLEVPHLTESDIVSVHRLPARQGNVPVVIIHFARQQTRDAWLKKKK